MVISFAATAVGNIFILFCLIFSVLKPGLDSGDFASYRPISNLHFLGETLERAVAAQLHRHVHLQPH